VGGQLAYQLDLPFHDLDAAIEDREGRTVAEIFAATGEAAFRQLEAEILPSLLVGPAVVALGGGAWEATVNRAMVTSADFAPLWLAESPTRAWARAGRDPHRPLAQDRAAFMHRWAARMPNWSLAPMLLPFGHSSGELASALLD
jgi:shikimate kinase